MAEIRTQQTEELEQTTWATQHPQPTWDPISTFYLSWHFNISRSFDVFKQPCYTVHSTAGNIDRLRWCPRLTAGECVATFNYTSLDQQDVFYKGHVTCTANISDGYDGVNNMQIDPEHSRFPP